MHTLVAAPTVTIVLLGATSAAAGPVETFVPISINYPGATSTQARGINTPGEVVGT
jgi:hypothetical protein